VELHQRGELKPMLEAAAKKKEG